MGTLWKATWWNILYRRRSDKVVSTAAEVMGLELCTSLLWITLLRVLCATSNPSLCMSRRRQLLGLSMNVKRWLWFHYPRFGAWRRGFLCEWLMTGFPIAMASMPKICGWLRSLFLKDLGLLCTMKGLPTICKGHRKL